MSSQKTFLEQRKISRNLVKAVIQAREAGKAASKARQKFNEQMALYLERCKVDKLKPKPQWINLLKYLATEEKDALSIMLALQIHPNSEDFLKTLEALKVHGFPEFFTNDLISEIPTQVLALSKKDFIKGQLEIGNEY